MTLLTAAIIRFQSRFNDCVCHTGKRLRQSIGPWTWCCDNCNSRLGSRYFDTFKDRCLWLQSALGKHAKPILWHPWELAQLDYGLRLMVTQQITFRTWAQARADFYGSRGFYLNLESLGWLVKERCRDTDAGNFLSAFFASTVKDVADRLYQPAFQSRATR